MRLINVNTLELEEFMEGSIPRYAILSHRWTGEELTYEEVADRCIDRTKLGFKKFAKSCRVAKREHQLDYLWNDTCCIDKRSSAKLQEAINSLCAWYRDAEVCLAYLEDVRNHLGDNFEKEFRRSAWFTRAWTLQKLPALSYVRFYDSGWRFFGDKEGYTPLIEQVTVTDGEALITWDVCLERDIAVKIVLGHQTASY